MITRFSLPAVAVLLAAACSSSSPAASGSPSGSPGSGALAYAHCMRAHGITNFPDPSSDGGFNIGPGIDPNSARYHDADHACHGLAAPGQSQAQQQKVYAYQLKYSSCMRTHGMPNFPDPLPPGSRGAAVNGSSASPGSGGYNSGGGINPNSAQFVAANKICEHFLPAGQGPSTSTSGGGS